MIILSLLSLLLNFSTSAQAEDITCNQLIEVLSDHDTGVMTYCNRYKIPVVDHNGKMMFDISIQRRGYMSRLSLLPAMDCRIMPSAKVTITFSDKTQYQVVSQNKVDESHIDIEINTDLRSKMMTDNILSIAFRGKKYPYNVVLKPNQGRVVQDVMNCLQN